MYALSLVPVWGKWQAQWFLQESRTNNCSIVAELTETLNPAKPAIAAPPLFFLYILTTMLLGCCLFSVLWRRVVCFLPLHKPWNANYYEEFPPVAMLHLDDERQLYGRPSLLRTTGSRVICNRSLSKTPQCHAGWAMLPHSSPCLLAEISAGCATFDM